MIDEEEGNANSCAIWLRIAYEDKTDEFASRLEMHTVPKSILGLMLNWHRYVLLHPDAVGCALAIKRPTVTAILCSLQHAFR